MQLKEKAVFSFKDEAAQDGDTRRRHRCWYAGFCKRERFWGQSEG